MAHSTMDQTREQLMKEVEETIIDAEFRVLTESNQETAITESGLSILIQNWSNQSK